MLSKKLQNEEELKSQQEKAKEARARACRWIKEERDRVWSDRQDGDHLSGGESGLYACKY